MMQEGDIRRYQEGPPAPPVGATSAQDVQIHFDSSFILTTPGLVRISIIVVNLIIFIITMSSTIHQNSTLSFMGFISGVGFWTTGVMLLFTLFHITEKYHQVPWLKIAFCYVALMTLFFFIGATVSLTNIGKTKIFGVVALFGYVSSFLHAFDCYLKYKKAIELRETSNAYNVSPRV